MNGTYIVNVINMKLSINFLKIFLIEYYIKWKKYNNSYICKSYLVRFLKKKLFDNLTKRKKIFKKYLFIHLFLKRE